MERRDRGYRRNTYAVPKASNRQLRLDLSLRPCEKKAKTENRAENNTASRQGKEILYNGTLDTAFTHRTPQYKLPIQRHMLES